ncbi:MAG: PAS domain S-box protein [Deltaproteobacteria bacterium]|nr:PAS domain S-box protein [Deltaproteobacteria bacterium]
MLSRNAGPKAQPVELILDATDQGIYVLDAEGRCTLFNRAASVMTGWGSEEGLGRSIHELIHHTRPGGSPHPPSECSVLGVLRTGEGVHKDSEIYWRKNGTPFPVEYSSSPIIEDGRTIGAVVVFIDITERKKVEKALSDREEELRLISDAGPTLISYVDSGGLYHWVNKTYAEWVGLSAREIRGLHVREVLGETAWLAVEPFAERVLAGEAVTYEHQLLMRDGPRWVRGTCTPDLNEAGQVRGFVEHALDIGERKEAEETYRATLNILEDFDEEKANLQNLQLATMNLLEDLDEERLNFQQIQKATLNLLEDMNAEREKSDQTQRALMNILDDVEVERVKAEQARALLESVNKELEAFSYSVSHDLRSPLRAISGFTQALMEDWAPLLDDDGKRYLALVQENAHRMGQLIDDLLTFSRLGRQTMTVTEIDMADLAQSVYDELETRTSGRNIAFTMGAIPPAQGDKALIRQVLVNLISNAVKFTQTRERALIEFGYETQGGDGAYFIRDNGVGFDMRYVDKLFGVFQRLHSVTEFEGTGVGLALVYRIVTRHGGSVWAEGRLDRGAAFYFSLPQKGTR